MRLLGLQGGGLGHHHVQEAQGAIAVERQGQVLGVGRGGHRGAFALAASASRFSKARLSSTSWKALQHRGRDRRPPRWHSRPWPLPIRPSCRPSSNRVSAMLGPSAQKALGAVNSPSLPVFWNPASATKRNIGIESGPRHADAGIGGGNHALGSGNIRAALQQGRRNAGRHIWHLRNRRPAAAIANWEPASPTRLAMACSSSARRPAHRTIAPAASAYCVWARPTSRPEAMPLSWRSLVRSSALPIDADRVAQAARPRHPVRATADSRRPVAPAG